MEGSITHNFTAALQMLALSGPAIMLDMMRMIELHAVYAGEVQLRRVNLQSLLVETLACAVLTSVYQVFSLCCTRPSFDVA